MKSTPPATDRWGSKHEYGLQLHRGGCGNDARRQADTAAGRSRTGRPARLQRIAHQVARLAAQIGELAQHVDLPGRLGPLIIILVYGLPKRGKSRKYEVSREGEPVAQGLAPAVERYLALDARPFSYHLIQGGAARPRGRTGRGSSPPLRTTPSGADGGGGPDPGAAAP